MTEINDTLGVLNLDTWNATDTNILSYLKTPIQQIFFINNSDLIGRTLRQAIIYFSDTINSIDRPTCIFGNEFRSRRTHKYQVIRSINEPSEITTMEITTLAATAFEYLRSAIGITLHDFRESFINGELINFDNTGKSGSQMYKTKDEVYIIKTLRDHEAKLLIQVLSGLYLHYSNTPTLMTRYVGLYSVNVFSIFTSEIYCVVMLNNLPSIIDIHEIYDLKGSIIGRISSIDFPLRRLKALKDLDFEIFYPHGIRIPHEIHRRLQRTLESDLLELKKMMITDFSLMLGVYQLDQYVKINKNGEDILQFEPKPQLGVSSLFVPINMDRTILQSGTLKEITEIVNLSKLNTIKKFIMKPLHLIACPQADTFDNSSIAQSLLGIPGVTHDGRRVLLYPAFIDCLQTYDNFKHIQHIIQNFRDPKRSADYSVIHPDEYEKRLIRFLLDKVFIDSKQTLTELLADPVLITNLNDTITKSFTDNEYEDPNGHVDNVHESFNMISKHEQEKRINQTTEVLHRLIFEPLITIDEMEV